MSLLLECGGCEARYDVSERAPGKKVRCPKCKTVLVVPERDPDVDVTASHRLRKSRGATCAKHKTTQASGTCQLCQTKICARCTAPAPIDHACKPCATELGLGGALPIDFGFLATYRLAAGVFWQQLMRLLTWHLLVSLAAGVVCLIPLIIGAMMVLNGGGPQKIESSLTAQLGASLAVGAIAFYWVMVNLLLLPAGGAVLADQDIRERRLGFGLALAETSRRVLRKAGALFLIFLVYGLLTLLLLLPTLLVVYYSFLAVGPERWFIPATLCGLILGLGFLFMATGLGMAVPVTMLEQRSAFESLGRSWDLAGQRFWQLLLVVLAYAIGYALLGGLAGMAGRLTVPLVGMILSAVLDLFWPALLVAAYHGLAAEDAGVLGRGKR